MPSLGFMMSTTSTAALAGYLPLVQLQRYTLDKGHPLVVGVQVGS